MSETETDYQIYQLIALHRLDAKNWEEREGMPTKRSEMHRKTAGVLEKLLAKNAALREAIEPFSKALDDLPSWADDCSDNQSIWDTEASQAIKIGHLRRARAALNQDEKADTAADETPPGEMSA